MPIQQINKRDIEALDFPIEVKSYGFNMLSGKKAKIIDCNTGTAPELKRKLKLDADAFCGCTSENVDEHIDILCEKADIICDLGSVTAVDNIVIRSFFSSSVNYTIGEFMLYAADTENELFDEENMLAHECGGAAWQKGKRNNADWVYDTVGTFRYLGIRILKSNETDDVIRLGHVGVYNNIYTEGKKYISENFPCNLLYSQEPLCVTDGLIYSSDSAFEISGEHTFNFSLKEPKKALKLWTVVYGEVSVDAGEHLTEDSVYNIEYGRKVYIFKAAADKMIDKLAVTCGGNGSVEQKGAYAGNTSVKVDFDDVIIDDFIGVGADVIPTALMAESIASGYNEVYWELEKCRIEKVRPHVVRLWFQLDWMVSEYEDYINGNLDFESEKMHALYKYLDIFKTVGTEVEFNFGWKIAEPVQSWFSFENVMNRSASAPKELEPFARACGKALYELIKNRGYSNIKYLTFFNESNAAESDSQFWRYDFAVPDGIIAREYYSDMLKLCKQSLLKYGLDDLEIWGFELTEKFDVWAECAKERCEDIVDRFTFHRYFVESSDDEESLQTTAGLFNKNIERINNMKKEISKNELNQRIKLNCNRMSESYYDIDNVFQQGTDWPGDKDGRALLAFVCHYKMSGVKISCMDKMIDKIPEMTENRMFFGAPSGEVLFEQQLSGHSWYLRGLCEYFEQFEDDRVLKYLNETFDNLYRPTMGRFSSYPVKRNDATGGVSGHSCGELNGWKLSTDIGCAFMSVDGLSHYFKITKNPDAKLLLEEMADCLDKIDIYNLEAQTHCTLTAARGLMRMYELTNDTRWLNQAEKIFLLYVEKGMTYTYQNFNWFKKGDTWTEPCAIVDSLMLSGMLYKATEKEEYRRYAVRIYFNGFASSQRPNGGAGTDTTVSDTMHDLKLTMFYEADFCCSMRFAEGLWYVKENADMLYAEVSGEVKKDSHGRYMDGDLIYAEIPPEYEKYADEPKYADGRKLFPLISYYKLKDEKECAGLVQKIIFES